MWIYDLKFMWIYDLKFMWIYDLKFFNVLKGLNVFYELFKTLPKIPGEAPHLYLKFSYN